MLAAAAAAQRDAQAGKAAGGVAAAAAAADMDLDAGELEQAGWGADELDLGMGGGSGAGEEEGLEGAAARWLRWPLGALCCPLPRSAADLLPPRLLAPRQPCHSPPATPRSRRTAGLGGEGDDEGWEMEDLELPADIVAEAPSASAAAFTAPAPGAPASQKWLDKRTQLAAEHAAAGAFQSAASLLHRQIGCASIEQLKPYLLDLHAAAFAALPGLHGVPPVVAGLDRCAAAAPPACLFPLRAQPRASPRASTLLTHPPSPSTPLTLHPAPPRPPQLVERRGRHAAAGVPHAAVQPGWPGGGPQGGLQAGH
jgi:coatomer protein complex subunit alpha (xenin)